jgi:tetratricopeptide (TPR) repeat protein
MGDQEMAGRTFTRLTGALIAAGRFEEAIETAHRGLAYLPADISAGRGRLLAGLAQALAGTGVYEPAHEALLEGLNIASQLSDPTLEARLLGVRSAMNFRHFRMREAAADGLRSQQLGASDSSPWQRAGELRSLEQILMYLGRLEEALRIADELEPLARKIEQSYEIALCLSVRAWIEFAKEPDLAKLEIGLGQVPKSDQIGWVNYWKVLSEVQLSQVNFFRGNWTSALLQAQAASSHLEPGSSRYGAGTLFRQMAYTGDRDAALAILEEERTRLPQSGQENSRGWGLMLALVVEGLGTLGERTKAAQLYPLVLELIATGTVWLWPISRLTQTIAGIAAAAARQWDAAEEHFQIAMQQARSLPNVLEHAEIHRFHAMMLIDRDGPSDREKAQTLLREALAAYDRIGMPRHIDLAQTLLDQNAGR